MSTATDAITQLSKRPGIDAPIEVHKGCYLGHVALNPIFGIIDDTLTVIILSDALAGQWRQPSQELTTFLIEKMSCARGIPTLVVARPGGPKHQHLRDRWILVDRDAFIEAISSDWPVSFQRYLSSVFLPWELMPYQSTQAVLPKMFFGRQKETDDLCALRTNYVVVGARRIGKTSLATKVQFELKKRNDFRYAIGDWDPQYILHAVMYVDCNQINAPQDVWRRLFEKAGLADRELTRQSRFLPSIGARLPGQMDDFDFFRLLVSNKFKRTLILLDEADRLIRDDRAHGYKVCGQLQSLIDERKYNTKVALFGHDDLLRAWGSDDFPLYHKRLKDMPLGRLSQGEVVDLIQGPMQQLGIKVPRVQGIGHDIHEATAGMPNLIQDICRLVLMRPTVNDRREVTNEDVQAVLGGEQIRETFDMLFGNIDPLPRLIAYLMVKDDMIQLAKCLHSLQQLRLDEGDDENEVKRALNQLVLYNILVSAGSEEYVFTSRMIQKHLRERLERDKDGAKVKAAIRAVENARARRTP